MSSTNIVNDFVSLKNKGILWGLMIENKIFNGISESYATTVRAEFEKHIQSIATQIQSGDTILNINKQVIIRMMETIKIYSNGSTVISNKKQEIFQKGLQTKQEEFNTLINPRIPDTIDFSDKIDDEPNGADMESKLAQTIAWREKQLNQVLEKQVAEKQVAEKQVSEKQVSEKQVSEKQVIKSSTERQSNKNIDNKSNHIRIGGAITSTDTSIIDIRRVRFTDATDATDANSLTDNKSPLSFIEKLKKRDIYEELFAFKTELITINKQIIENQHKILELLQNNYAH
jgi:hypothetical protein